METDEGRNLLFGALALEVGLIDADQLAQACALWVGDRSKTLPAILCEKGWLRAEDRPHLDYLAARRLARFDGDVRASFAGCPAAVRGVLASVCDDTTGGSAPQATIAFTEGADAPAEPTSVPPGQRYTLNALHAAGGIGEIWLARDRALHRDVAVKRLQSHTAGSAVTRSRFLREAQITGQLDHPGVVPIYEICADADGEPYYAMRFLKGRTLTDAVREYHQHRKASGSDPQRFLNLLGAFRIVCNTVAYAHSKGVVHRDLKCDNVLLGDYGEVVVIDWGLAKEVGGDVTPAAGAAEADLASAHPAATLAGHILGTPAYMAPEQAAGRLDRTGFPTDVYGLCAILYEILTGQPPFLGGNALEVLRRVEHEPPTPPGAVVPGVPEALERICLKGLAKSPDDRHPSADSLARAVQAWVSDLAERRQAEEERERFFALSLDLLAIVDAAGRLRQVGPAWGRLLGHDGTDLAGGPFLEFLHANDRDAASRCLAAVAAGRGADTFEARAVARDGGCRWISWNATPIAKEDCVYVVGRDVTELKRSRQLFEGVLQSAPDAMVLIDPIGRIVMTNRQTERLFGYAQAELLGRPVEVLIPERFRERHPAHVAGFFAASSVRPMGTGAPLRGLRKDGTEFSVDIALSPIATESGPLVAASVRAVSGRKE